MGILDNLFGNNKKKWNDIKKTDKVYPQNSISILMMKTESGKPSTGWVDKAYKQYEYKKFCPYNFMIMVSLKDSVAQKNPTLDMGTIETFFTEELRKVGIAHIIARVATDDGVNIEMQLEDNKAAMEHLQNILADPNRLVSFNCEVNYDPKWTAVAGLMNL
jgi:hypothetical protein